MNFNIETTTGSCHVQVLDICKRIHELEPNDDEPICFDFTGYYENSPFSNLVLINALRHVRAKYPDAVLSIKPNSNSYLTFVGFYQAIGINYGNPPGAARGSDTYVPVTEINTDSPLFYNDLGDVVGKLAKTLNYSPALEYMLRYVFYESIRNVHEHAKADSVLVAAQKWPSRSLLEISIADAGCGVTESLGKRFSKEPIELLRLACQPGITALSNASYTADNDPLRNSGYGLFVMKELTIRCKGRFMLCSDNHALLYNYSVDGAKEYVLPTEYKGLALCLQFRTNEVINFYSEIPNIAHHGEVLASNTEGAIKKASRSSRSAID